MTLATSVQPPGGCILSGLRIHNEWHAAFVFQSFEQDIIRQITSRTIQFINQQSVQPCGVLLNKLDQFAERLSLITFGSGFSDTKEPGNFTFTSFSVLAQSVFVNIERESFPLLFTTAHSRHCNESSHFTFSSFTISTN
jgi:hypothetical protein